MLMHSSHVELHSQIESLYSDNHRWLQAWLHQKLHCSQRAADLLHDTFIRLLSREQVIEAREPKAHLMVVAKRVLLDHWRRERIEQAYLKTLLSQGEARAPGPEEQHLILETLLEIDRLLDGLPGPVKHAFLYAQLHGLKQAEIAEKMALSISTIKRYLVRAGTQCYFALQIEP